jgi:hypothetical protein
MSERAPVFMGCYPAGPGSDAVSIGLQAMMQAVLATAPVAHGPRERVMALACLIGAEISAVAADRRQEAEMLVVAAICGATRGATDARLMHAAPQGQA